MRRPARGCPLCRRHPEDCRAAATFEGGAAMATYHITLRDRETQTVVGYYNGAWTTDPRRSLALGRREAAEAPCRPHARSLSAQRRPHQGRAVCRRRLGTFYDPFRFICRRRQPCIRRRRAE